MSKPTELLSFDIDQVSLHRNFRSSKTIDPKGIDEMAESILEHGIIQPPPAIMVEGKPQVTMGQRRYYGFLRAGVLAEERKLTTVPWSDAPASEALSKIPLLVSDIDERTVMLQQMVENLQREDVSLRDESEGYAYLQAEHSMTLEEIAQRIGKSKQRVSACIKLRNVPEEMWAAYEEKKISSEHLVLVGRVPHAKDREKLAKTVLTPKYNGLLMTREDVTQHIKAEYMIALRGCEWKLDDATLVPVETDEEGKQLCGGACKDCPFRSGNDADLASEVQTGKEGSGSKAGIDANLCLNPTCYRTKQEAAWKALRAKSEAQGIKVLSDAEAKDHFESWGGSPKQSTGLVLLDEEPDYYATGAHGEASAIEGQSWEDLIDGKEAKKACIVCRHPKTKKIVRMIDRETAIQLAEVKIKERLGKDVVSPFANRPKPKAAVSPQDEQKKTEADKRKRERDHKVNTLMSRLVWDGIADGLRTKPMTDSMLKNAVRQAFTLATYDTSDLVFQICGLDPEARKNTDSDWADVERFINNDIDKSDKAAGYIRWIVLLLSVAEMETVGYFGQSEFKCEGVSALMKALRIDADKLKAKATEAVKAQEKEASRGEAKTKQKAREGMAGMGQSGASLSEIEAKAEGEPVFDADAELRARCREYRTEHPKCTIYDLVTEFMIDRDTATLIFDALVDEKFDGNSHKPAAKSKPAKKAAKKAAKTKGKAKKK